MRKAESEWGRARELDRAAQQRGGEVDVEVERLAVVAVGGLRCREGAPAVRFSSDA
jgi:hypothetical protein